MLSFATLRYRNILASASKPIARLETRDFVAFGRRYFQANAWLASGLVPRRRALAVYSDADGTGAHASRATARHMAISEALERWAYHATVAGPAGSRFGFDIDHSSNGMAAYPSWGKTAARRVAMLEGIERFCVLCWWEDRLDGERRTTEWPGVSAVAIDGPFGGVTAILYRRSDWGFTCYGHAAAESFTAASEKALVELFRHESVLRGHSLVHGGVAGGPAVTDPLERRSMFFAQDEGHDLFLRRLHRGASKPPYPPTVIADAEIRGPWSRYAHVWRFALRPPSPRFLEDDERYFFW